MPSTKRIRNEKDLWWSIVGNWRPPRRKTDLHDQPLDLMTKKEFCLLNESDSNLINKWTNLVCKGEVPARQRGNRMRWVHIPGLGGWASHPNGICVLAASDQVRDRRWLQRNQSDSTRSAAKRRRTWTTCTNTNKTVVVTLVRNLTIRRNVFPRNPKTTKEKIVVKIEKHFEFPKK